MRSTLMSVMVDQGFAVHISQPRTKFPLTVRAHTRQCGACMARSSANPPIPRISLFPRFSVRIADAYDAVCRLKLDLDNSA